MQTRSTCQGCRDGDALPFAFTMAFQPIVDLARGQVWGYEALVRGPAGESAASVLAQVTDKTLYKFDQACRVRAIELAGRLLPLDDDTMLSINFMPNAVYEPAACIRASLEAARRVGLRQERLMFEFTEDERFTDTAHMARIVTEYKRQGFLTALDDFGAGYSGLNLLANFQTDLIKIDMALIRGIDADPVRQAIVAGIIGIARALDLRVIAEGVETDAEIGVLRAAGIALFQGYRLAKPQVEQFPTVIGMESFGFATAVA
ncbi:EAL domain-containing protein [Beijerinckia sp. L45]|uniref:EAL domain-containing protein n=1 Tax=Beijerinckia sp. L45 TaxID=1641855 RepID=UPI00131A93CA|nr:EAL domain-containing protein [Beijerinckia sp. L45]